MENDSTVNDLSPTSKKKLKSKLKLASKLNNKLNKPIKTISVSSSPVLHKKNSSSFTDIHSGTKNDGVMNSSTGTRQTSVTRSTVAVANSGSLSNRPLSSCYANWVSSFALNT
jgi:hypothetical protein